MLDHLIANAIFIFYKHSSLMLIIRKYMKFCTHTNYLKQVNRMLNLNSALMIRKYIDLKNTKKWLALNLILLYIFYRKICIFVLWCKMYFNTFPLIVSRWCCIAFFCNKSATNKRFEAGFCYSRSRFHQHFTSRFFVRKYFKQLLMYLEFELLFFVGRKSTKRLFITYWWNLFLNETVILF